MSYNSRVIVLVISNHPRYYSLNCTPLSRIAITNLTTGSRGETSLVREKYGVCELRFLFDHHCLLQDSCYLLMAFIEKKVAA